MRKIIQTIPRKICTFGLYSDNKGRGLPWNRRVVCVMLLTPQELNQQCTEDVKSLHKINSVPIFNQTVCPSSKQCAGPFLAFLCAQTMFSCSLTSLQSCCLTAQLILRDFKTHHTEMELLLPEAFVEPSASQCSTCGCCRLTPHTSPVQEPPDMTQRTQLFNTLLWRRPLLSPGCFHWEQGTRTADLLWFYCLDIGIAKNQSKGQSASQKLYNLHHFIFFFSPNIMFKFFKGKKFLLPLLHIFFKKSMICPKALINFIDTSGQFWISNPPR